LPISDSETEILHNAIFFLSIGERVALVIIPTCCFPIYTPSPCSATSLLVNSNPTRVLCGEFLRRINDSLPEKSSSFVLSGTVNAMPASNGSVWSQNSYPAKI